MHVRVDVSCVTVGVKMCMTERVFCECVWLCV